jgi:polysaccharide export outer membrane protein
MRTLLPRLGSLVFACVVLSLPAAAQDPGTASNQLVLTPGDSVRIAVWRKPEFSGDFVVAPDGSITHPLYRTVRVAGVPFPTAEANLRKFLSGFEDNPQFVMEPLLRVAVSGEVDRPQVFATRPGTTIGEAVARAGGVTLIGNRNKVRVLRLEPNGEQQQLMVDLTQPNSTSRNILVRSGDQIVVDKKKSFFKDIMLPALGVIGSIASLGLLIDRVTRKN